MYLKFFFFTLLTSITLLAQSYNFSELRYSDAIGKSSQLDGKIEFTKDGLNIEYPKKRKKLVYDGKGVLLFQDDKKVELKEQQERYMMQYFEILKMLHKGDESELKEEFEIEKKEYKILLRPTSTLKYYINFIELTEENKILNYIKLFLKNNDTITIHIENETE
jgi:outer membrane lipoprotein-sorting protein